jgi:hypothetical protein
MLALGGVPGSGGTHARDQRCGPVMLDTIQGITLLTIMEIVGPILLAIALIYGIVVTSRRRRSWLGGQAGECRPRTLSSGRGASQSPRPFLKPWIGVPPTLFC